MKGFVNQVGGYFNNTKQGQGVSTHNVPQQHQIRNRTIQEEKILSEGGFGYIWRAYDVNTREVFALKRMICQGQDRVQIAKREMRNLEMLPQHQNVVRFYGGNIIPTPDGCIAIFLMEMCDGGSLFDLMSQSLPNKLPERKLIHIINEAAKGIRALHQSNPPITHRDIKIENILCGGGVYKLCDFGSCSTKNIDFSQVPKSQYDQYEDLFNQSTTMMYRPPEMCDPAKCFIVDTKVDVWMLGCTLYTIAFFTHPFVDSAKVAIIDAAYRFPQDSPFSKKFHDFIRHMITPDPSYRPSIHDVIQICENYDRLPSIKLNQVAQQIKDKEDERLREEHRFEQQNGHKIKKFDGDIPMEELMKLQQKVKANHGGDDEDDGGCTFIKKSQPVQKKKVQKEDVELERIRQQFGKGTTQSNANTTGQRQSAMVTGSNQNNQNQFWNFSSPQNYPNQQQQQKNQQQSSFNNQNFSQKSQQASDPFSQFGFNSNNSNNNNNQSANDAFDNFNFAGNNQNNQNNVFDQFGFPGNNNQGNFNSNNNQSQNKSNYNSTGGNNNSNQNNNNQQQNIWEFYENTNDNQQNYGSNSQNQQALNNFNSNQYGSNNSNQQAQQFNSNNNRNQQPSQFQQNDPFQQFGSNNQNYSNSNNQNYSNSNNNNSQQRQQQTVDLLDLDDGGNKNANNKGGAFNLLDLGLEL